MGVPWASSVQWRRRTVILLTFLVVFSAVIPFGFLGKPSGVWANEWSGTLTQPALLQAGPAGTEASDVIAETFTMASLTWTGPAPLEAFIRYRRSGSGWSDWDELEIGSEEGPDLGTEGGVDGWTEIIYVGSQDEAQFALGGSDLSTVDVSLIDTAERTKPLSLKIEEALFSASADAAPSIRTRAAWDPEDSCEPRTSPPDTIKPEGAVVHHTVSGLTSASTVPGVILAICLFHRNSRGWDDIGYNFLVDPFGQAWEGRAGGIDQGVRGASTAGFNSFTFGIAMIGDYSGAVPSPATLETVAEVIAWKFSIHDIPPAGTTTVVVTGSQLHPDGATVAIDRVSGHRDLGATRCPGDGGYSTLGSIRTEVETLTRRIPVAMAPDGLAGYRPHDGRLVMERFVLASGGEYFWEANVSGSVLTDLLEGTIIWAGELGSGTGRDVLLYSASSSLFQFWTAAPNGDEWSKFFEQTGTRGWTHLIPGDFDGNGVTDLLFYKADVGLMRFYTVTSSGFRPLTPAMTGTKFWSEIVPGDFDGDGSDDLLFYRREDGLMRFYEVDISGLFAPISPVLWGTGGWSQIPSGNFDGIGNDDLLFYRQDDGLARYYTVEAKGVLTPISVVSVARPGFDLIVPGQFDSDPSVDLVWHRRNLTTSVTTTFVGSGDIVLGFQPDRLYFTDGLFARIPSS